MGVKCWKVVKMNYAREEFVSLYARGEASVTYEIGALTRPPEWLRRAGHGIIAYDSLAAAASSASGVHKVMECAVMGPQRELPKFCKLDNLSRGTIVGTFTDSKFPAGSVAFDGVIPMRFVPLAEQLEAREAR